MRTRKTLGIALVLVTAFVLGGALTAQTSGPAAVSRVVVVDTANAAAYASAIAEGQAILTGLGSNAKIRVWVARFAGEGAGQVVASIEWPSMAAMAADDERMAGSAEMQSWLASLAGNRTIVSDSLYQEITQ